MPARSIASSCSTVSVKGPPMVTTTLHLSYRIASGRSRRDVDRTCSLSVPPSKFLRRPFVAYFIPPPAVFTCDLIFMDPMAGRASLVAACAEDSAKTRCYLNPDFLARPGDISASHDCLTAGKSALLRRDESSAACLWLSGFDAVSFAKSGRSETSENAFFGAQ